MLKHFQLRLQGRLIKRGDDRVVRQLPSLILLLLDGAREIKTFFYRCSLKSMGLTKMSCFF